MRFIAFLDFIILINTALDSCGFPCGFFIWLDWLFYEDLCLCKQAPCATIRVPINPQCIHCDSSHNSCILTRQQRDALDAMFLVVGEDFRVWLCLQGRQSFWGKHECTKLKSIPVHMLIKAKWSFMMIPCTVGTWKSQRDVCCFLSFPMT